MQKQHRGAILGDFCVLSTIVILFASAVALVGCGGGGSTGTGMPEVPRYYADEPNDTWQLANIIPSELDRVYEVEGNIHHGDIDHIACILPFPRQDDLVDISVDYAAGWDMEVQVGWIDPFGAVTPLWGAYDAWGDGNLSTQVLVPEEAGWLGLTIRQTQNPLPDATRYTFTVEVL